MEETNAAQASPLFSPHAVYLSNLPFDVTKDVVTSKFDSVGISVVSVELLQKGVFSRLKNSGLATVLLSSSDDVTKACGVLDGSRIYERPMIVRKDKFVEDDLAYTPAQKKPQNPQRVAA